MLLQRYYVVDFSGFINKIVIINYNQMFLFLFVLSQVIIAHSQYAAYLDYCIPLFLRVLKEEKAQNIAESPMQVCQLCRRD